MGHMPPHRCERSGLSPHLWKCLTQEGSLKPRKAVIPRSCEICPSSLCGNVCVPKDPGGTPALGVAWKESRSAFKEKGADLQTPLWTRLCLHFSGLQNFTIENAESFSLQVIHRKCQPRPALFNSGWELLTLLAEGLGFPQVQWSTVSCEKRTKSYSWKCHHFCPAKSVLQESSTLPDWDISHALPAQRLCLFCVVP